VRAHTYSDGCGALEREERVGGGAVSFVQALAVGSFLLAIWCDTRLSEHRPATLTRRVVHVAVSGVLLQVAAIGVTLVGPTDAGAARQLTAVFVVLMPALVYAFLTGLWVIRTLAEAGLARH